MLIIKNSTFVSKFENMRKISLIIVAILVSAFVLTSCVSSKSCPAYAKAPAIKSTVKKSV